MMKTDHFRVRAAISAAVLALCLLALVATTEPAGAAFPGENGRIFFETARDDGRTNIYSINPDGTGASNLPRSSAGVADTNPAVSSNGTKVAYEHDRDIWVMNADGTNPKPVTNDGGATTDLQPAWSPDGTKIAFYGITSSSREIYTINADGTGRAPITSTATQDSNPAWSPDGTKIAYTVCCHNIWVTSADGSGTPTNLTGGSTFPGVADGSQEPNFSPDGEKIVFTGGPDCDFSCTGTDIYVMDSGGGGEDNLTPNPENHFQPVFSPDGAKIAFTSDTINGTNFDIFTMDADGSDLDDLTNDAAQDQNPDWGVPERIPPTVKSTAPANRATGARRSTNVTATFSEAMNPDTLDASTITLKNTKTGASVAAASVGVSPDGRTATFDPSPAKLGKKAKYEARVATGAEDLAGNALAQDKVWTFTTGKK